MSARRALIEAQLTDAELGVLASLCASIPIPITLWTECSAIARPFIVLAVERLASRIRIERSVSLTGARETAAIRLGVEPDTVRQQRRRWRSRVYATLCSTDSDGGADRLSA